MRFQGKIWAERITLIIEPAPDVPGVWLAHYQELNVLSEGENPTEAAISVLEAAKIVMEDAAAGGLNLQRGAAE